MDLFLSILKSVIYGVIEGITEWLPISSTGHMILAEQVLKFGYTEDFMEMFRVVIQLGAILAVVVLYFHKLWPFCKDNGRDTGFAAHLRWPVVRLWFKIIAACVPAAVLGILLDGNGTIEIPTMIDDGGKISTGMDKRLRFILWRDFAAEDETGSHFGVYDSEYSFFLALPESMHGSVLLRTNRDGSGWMVCNREGTTVYCELRLTDPAKETQTPDIDGEQTEAGEYRRIANIGSQQLQARVVTPYYGLSIDDIIHGTTVFR